MNRIKVKTLRFGVVRYILLAILLFTTLIGVITSLIESEHLQEKQDRYKQNIERTTDYIMQKSLHEYENLATAIIEQEALANCILEHNGRAVDANFDKKWQELKKRYEALMLLHIHLADGTLFRDVYDDAKLNQVRKSKELIRSRIPVERFSYDFKKINSYLIFSLKNPIFDAKGNYLGYLELGVNLQTIVNNISKISGLDGVIYYKDKNGNFQLLSPSLLAKIKLRGHSYTVHEFKLKNILGKEEIKIDFFQDITDDGTMQNYLFLMIFCMLVLLAWYVFRLAKKYELEVETKYQSYIKSIEEKEAYFRYLYDNMPDAYHSLDINGNIIAVNKKWQEELGYSEQEVLGRNIAEFLTPEYKKLLKERFEKFKNDGSFENLEFDFLAKDGTVVTTLISGKISNKEDGSFNKTHCVFSNITRDREIRKALERNEHFLQTIFDTTENFIITTDGMKLTSVNRATLEFFNYSSLEVFKNEHECICDFFLDEKGCVSKYMGELNWLEYMQAYEEEVHMVSMMRGDKKHYFLVKMYPLEIENNILLVFFNDITKLRENEQEYRDLSRLFTNVMDSLDNILFVKDKELRYIAFNRAFENFVGKSRDEIIAHTDYEIFDKDVADFFREKDTQMLVEARSKSNYEWVTYPNGDEVYLLTLKAPLRSETGEIIGLVGNSADVTQRKRLEEKLVASEELFEYFMANVPYVVAIKDENLKLKYVNAKAKKYAEKIDLAQTSGENIGHEYGEKVDALARKAQIEGSAEELAEYENENGKYIFRVLAFAIPQKDGAIYVGTIYIDITEQKEMANELKEKDEMMLAQSRHAAMGEMISMIAHQWRQPISVISMDANNILADIELDSVEEESLKSDANDIVEQTLHLSKTIDDFSNFFKPDKLKDEVLVNDVLEDSLQIIGKSLENNNISVENSFDTTTKVTIFSRELLQVFLNILKNAKDVLVEKRLENRKISNKIYEDKEYVIVEISDNGGGIDEAILEKIFDPYFSTKDAKNGTGLGLYMSKVIVEKHLSGIITASNGEDYTLLTIKIPKNNQEKEIKVDSSQDEGL